MPAWPAEQGKIQFDAAYEPVVADGRLFVGSMVDGGVTAYDLTNGEVLWRRFCNAPVRFAPVVHEGLVIVAADDGVLRAWDATNGKLRWRFDGAPRDRRILGNDRLISLWPARGAPVVKNDRVHFAAGIWPFMGVFVYAVDVNTGEEVWANSNSGSRYLVQQHNSPAFAGVAPQGYLAANDNELLVAGGRTTPACFNISDGKFRYFRPGDRTLGKSAGGFEVMLGPDWYANHGGVYGVEDGKPWQRLPIELLCGDQVLTFQGDTTKLLDAKPIVSAATDRRGEKTEVKRSWNVDREVKLNGAERILFRSGQLLWAVDSSHNLLAFDLASNESTLEPAWKVDTVGDVSQAIYANGRLIVTTAEGHLLSYGPPREEPAQVWKPAAEIKLNVDDASRELLKNSPRAPGYAVLLGWDEGVAVKLAVSKRGRVLVLESDAEIVEAARMRLQPSGLLGRQIDVIHVTEATRLAPYFADLVVATDLETGASLLRGERRLAASWEMLRPYGGVLLFPAGDAPIDGELLNLLKPTDYEVRRENLQRYVKVERPGPLPGSGSWTHQNGDIGNSLVSQEQNVKAPLGMLWFGGPSHQEVLPRHGHGPAPQVIGGRLFIEGPHMLRAVDVYTGRLLWQRELPNLGVFYDNTGHHPGAGAIGGNYCTTEDSVYVVYGRKCLRLDPATGETLAEFSLPEREGRVPYWGFIGVHEDYLIAGVEPTSPLSKSRWKEDGAPRFGEGSRGVAVLNRLTGKTLWSRDAKNNFRHNAIVAGGDTLFVLDRISKDRLNLLRRRGDTVDGQGRLLALSLENGEEKWSDDRAFGTWLGFSREHQVLLQAGARNRDRAADETAKGMIVYRASDGKEIWSDPKRYYAGPCLLLADRIITQGAAFDLQTGEPLYRGSPLNSHRQPWSFIRAYGCNTAIGCPTMLTFRSAAAGYYDLLDDSGTGNWGGFRSSCTSNLIPADGVLNAPDYTRTCSCSYQNQCSLALIHMPDVETWTFRQEVWNGEAIERLGLNLGAPGDRQHDDTLWLDFPSVGGPSPDIPVKLNDEAEFQREHSLRVSDNSADSDDANPAWIRATGAFNVSSLQLTLDRKSKTKKRYRVEFIVRPRVADVQPLTVRIGEHTQSVRATTADQPTTRLQFPAVEVVDKLDVSLQSESAAQWLVCGIQVTRLDR